MIEVDLHLHTTYSDGKLTPTQLVRLCGSRGLKVIAISDHDSTEGIPEALSAATEFPDVTVIPAIELSTDVPGSEVHVLGYFVERDDLSFQETLRRFREGRVDRARTMVEKLKTLGVAVSWERVKELSGGGAVGRPHVAQAMVEAGYVKYPRDAFDKYLGRNGPAYVDRVKLSPSEAVEILLGNGALPVLAHPTYSTQKSGREGFEEIRGTLLSLKEAGLVGVEVYYCDYTPDEVRGLAELAQEMGLVPCGGTDYHASGNPDEPVPGAQGPPMKTFEALQALRKTD